MASAIAEPRFKPNIRLERRYATRLNLSVSDL